MKVFRCGHGSTSKRMSRIGSYVTAFSGERGTRQVAQTESLPAALRVVSKYLFRWRLDGAKIRGAARFMFDRPNPLKGAVECQISCDGRRISADELSRAEHEQKGAFTERRATDKARLAKLDKALGEIRPSPFRPMLDLGDDK